MDRSIKYSIIWFAFLILLICFGIFMFNKSFPYKVAVGPYHTYPWYNATSTIIGDGETELYLKSDSGNFTVYDENDRYVASGQPVEMKPGDTVQTFATNFILVAGHKYTLSDHSADIFTLTPSIIHFEAANFVFIWLAIFAVFILFISILAIT